MCKTGIRAAAGKDRTFTWEELAKHNTPDDLFVAYRGYVYDVTKFLDRHPGGRDALLYGAGRDVTQLFESYHKFNTASLLSKFRVGRLVSDELPTFPEPSPFYKTAKNRVENYFKETGKDPKWHWKIAVIYPAIYISWLSAYYLEWFYFENNLPMQILSAIWVGLASAFVGLMPMHDSSHFSVTHNPTVWKLIGLTHDLANGASFHNWMYQHTLGHHPYTNIDGADPDICTNDQDFRRIKWLQPWMAQYFKQHVWVPLLYCFLSLKTRYQDLTLVFRDRRNGAIRMNKTPTVDLAFLLAGKVWWFFLRLMLPIYFHGVARGVLMCLVNDFATSYWLALSFQCSHVTREVDWLEIPKEIVQKDGTRRIIMPVDWAEMQVATTQDYAYDNALTTFLVGALNHQMTHHLFPGICQYHYPEISPIVQKTAQEFGIRTYYKDTFTEALGAHVGHLKDLGEYKSFEEMESLKKMQ
eukprot:Rmarinus@m.27953